MLAARDVVRGAAGARAAVVLPRGAGAAERKPRCLRQLGELRELPRGQ